MEVEHASEILLSLAEDETQPIDTIWSNNYATAAEESFLTAVRNRKSKCVDEER
jgi:hypothetical protein